MKASFSPKLNITLDNHCSWKMVAYIYFILLSTTITNTTNRLPLLHSRNNNNNTTYGTEDGNNGYKFAIC